MCAQWLTSSRARTGFAYTTASTASTSAGHHTALPPRPPLKSDAGRKSITESDSDELALRIVPTSASMSRARPGTSAPPGDALRYAEPLPPGSGIGFAWLYAVASAANGEGARAALGTAGSHGGRVSVA